MRKKQEKVTWERISEATPSGGDYVIVRFFDSNKKPTDKENAVHFEIEEYSKDGALRMRTYS